jgi:hypothetical protein
MSLPLSPFPLRVLGVLRVSILGDPVGPVNRGNAHTEGTEHRMTNDDR